MRNTSFLLILGLAVSGAGCTVVDNASNDAGTGDDTGTVDSAPADTPAGDDASDAAPGPTVDQACGDWATKFCAKYKACSNFEFSTAYDTSAVCVARITTLCKDQLGSAVAKLTPAWQAGCTAAIDTYDCHLVASDYLPDACKPPAGTIANMGFCAWNSDCQSGYCSHVDQGNGASCGLCADAPKAGEACAGKSKSECGFGLTCASGKCARRVDNGASCSSAAPCVAGYECFQGKCVPGLKGGDNCDVDVITTAPCDSSEGVYCGVGGATVCNGPAVGTAGEACNPGFTFVCPTGQCDVTTNKCPAFAAEGGSCNNGANCAPGAICDVGTCRTPNAAFCQTSPG
jgi:hypothetical protein